MPGNHLNCFDLGPRKLSERRTEGAENCMHCTAASAGAINVMSVCAPAGRRKKTTTTRLASRLVPALVVYSPTESLLRSRTFTITRASPPAPPQLPASVDLRVTLCPFSDSFGQCVLSALKDLRCFS